MRAIRLVAICAAAVGLSVVATIILWLLLADHVAEPSAKDMHASQSRYFPLGPGGEW